MKYIWCDEPNHNYSDCSLYVDALKEGTFTFRERRIRDATTDEPLRTNFGKGGMKKLMEDKLDKTSFIHARGAEIYYIEVGPNSMKALSNTTYKIMIRRT